MASNKSYFLFQQPGQRNSSSTFMECVCPRMGKMQAWETKHFWFVISPDFAVLVVQKSYFMLFFQGFHGCFQRDKVPLSLADSLNINDDSLKLPEDLERQKLMWWEEVLSMRQVTGSKVNNKLCHHMMSFCYFACLHILSDEYHCHKAKRL